MSIAVAAASPLGRSLRQIAARHAGSRTEVLAGTLGLAGEDAPTWYAAPFVLSRVCFVVLFHVGTQRRDARDEQHREEEGLGRGREGHCVLLVVGCCGLCVRRGSCVNEKEDSVCWDGLSCRRRAVCLMKEGGMEVLRVGKPVKGGSWGAVVQEWPTQQRR